jgi:hypothetical protein
VERSLFEALAWDFRAAVGEEEPLIFAMDRHEYWHRFDYSEMTAFTPKTYENVIHFNESDGCGNVAEHHRAGRHPT